MLHQRFVIQVPNNIILDLMKNDLDTAGIIYLYPTSFLPEVNEMSKQIPIVNIGDKNDEITFDSIHISSVKPARLVAEHLISLGHRKITYISTPITDIERSRSKRYDALVATFKEHGFGDDCVQIVLFLLENIICFLQIFWNILPVSISQSKSSRKERTALLLSDIMIW